MKKTVLCFLLTMLMHSVVAAAEPERVPQAPAPGQEKPAAAEPQTPLKEYREILEKERKLLDEQSERYYARVDTLITRATGFFGVVGVIIAGIATWIGISSRKELKEARMDARSVFQFEIEKQGITTIRDEFVALRSKYRELQEEIEAVTAYQKKRIVWVDWQGNEEPKRELEALKSAGLRNVKRKTFAESEAINLKSADLVILSYDGGDTSKSLMQRAIEEMPPTLPMLIYTLKGFRFDPKEVERMNEKYFVLMANFPAALVGHALALIRLSKQ